MFGTLQPTKLLHHPVDSSGNQSWNIDLYSTNLKSIFFFPTQPKQLRLSETIDFFLRFEINNENTTSCILDITTPLSCGVYNVLHCNLIVTCELIMGGILNPKRSSKYLQARRTRGQGRFPSTLVSSPPKCLDFVGLINYYVLHFVSKLILS